MNGTMAVKVTVPPDGAPNNCDVLQCTHAAPFIVIAAADGDLGGRHWHVGDPINLCWDHFRIVKTGRDPIKETGDSPW